MRLGPLKLKLQLVCGDGVAIGPGEADLLDAIITDGSRSAARRRLAMSYRRARLLVDQRPLVRDAVGGDAARWRAGAI